jgi:predicted esterase
LHTAIDIGYFAIGCQAWDLQKMLRTLAVIIATLLVSSFVAQAQQRGPFAVLMPGSGGIVPGDFLVRNEARFTAAGIETKLTTSPAEAVALVSAARASGRKTVIVGMSRGALTTASAIAAGASASGAVFVSGDLARVSAQLGAPSKLPPTLVVHHRRDGCRSTSPAGVEPFVRWSGGRARVQWIDTTGNDNTDPCRAASAHGFYRVDGPAVSAIIGFIRSR